MFSWMVEILLINILNSIIITISTIVTEWMGSIYSCMKYGQRCF